MTIQNNCYTYFKIDGNFNPDDVSKLLNLIPEQSWKIGDVGYKGVVYDFAHWEIGKCTEYDFEVENQMRKTIAPLLDKIPLLNRIRTENDVSLVLEIVPEIYVGVPTPCLAPPLDVIDFCHATRTEIDIDMYVFPSDSKLAR